MRRFITLIDVLYESHAKVFLLVDAPLAQLYDRPPRSSHVSTGEEEHFALDRTLSRLSEMQSNEYLRDHYIRVHHPERFASMRGHTLDVEHE